MPQKDKRNIRPTVRPLPYYSVDGTREEKVLAKYLRAEVSDKIARRLPGHHLGGWNHRRIVSSVAKYKQEYPFFLKVDIEQFYPSVQHSSLVVGSQIAYRDLLGLDYVPKAYKRKFLPAVQQWTNNLPLQQGIPLGSAMSAILAPLMLVPLWLEVKRTYHTPLLVYMDDALIFCRSEQQAARLYGLIEARLWYNYKLKINTTKVQVGRFSRKKLQFCGWEFAGGYAHISPAKIESFKEKINNKIKIRRKEHPTVFLKRINRSIDGFANYYKHGHVRKQFGELDAYVRVQVRKHLKATYGISCSRNADLQKLGLHSLTNCYDRLQARTQELQPTPSLASYLKRTPTAPNAPNETLVALKLLCEQTAKLSRQLTELTVLNQKIVKKMDTIYL